MYLLKNRVKLWSSYLNVANLTDLEKSKACRNANRYSEISKACRHANKFRNIKGLQEPSCSQKRKRMQQAQYIAVRMK